MIGKYPPLTEQRYKKNHFYLIPSEKYCNMFLLYFHKELVGYINIDNMNIMRNGKIKTIFFWITQAEICNGHLSILSNNIGKLTLNFNENSKKWKLNEVIFTKIPGNFLPLTRKVIIEKFRYNGKENKKRQITYRY